MKFRLLIFDISNRGKKIRIQRRKSEKNISKYVLYTSKKFGKSLTIIPHTSSIQLSPRGGSVELTSGRFGILRYSVTPPLAERWKAASTPSATATLSSTALTFRCTRAVCKRLAMTRTATTREQPFESSISAVSRECFFGCFFIFTPAFLPEVYRFSTRDFDRYPVVSSTTSASVFRGQPEITYRTAVLLHYFFMVSPRVERERER